jgi:hypothetical protein
MLALANTPFVWSVVSNCEHGIPALGAVLLGWKSAEVAHISPTTGGLPQTSVAAAAPPVQQVSAMLKIVAPTSLSHEAVVANGPMMLALTAAHDVDAAGSHIAEGSSCDVWLQTVLYPQSGFGVGSEPQHVDAYVHSRVRWVVVDRRYMVSHTLDDVNADCNAANVVEHGYPGENSTVGVNERGSAQKLNAGEVLCAEALPSMAEARSTRCIAFGGCL